MRDYTNERGRPGDEAIQLSDDELGIGTSTCLLWCGDLVLSDGFF